MSATLTIEWPIGSAAGTEGMGDIHAFPGMAVAASGADLPGEDTFVYWTSDKPDTIVDFMNNKQPMVRNGRGSTEGMNSGTSFTIDRSIFGRPIKLTAALYKDGADVEKDSPLAIAEHQITFMWLAKSFPFTQSAPFAISQLPNNEPSYDFSEEAVITLEVTVLNSDRLPFEGVPVLWSYQPAQAGNNLQFWIADASGSGSGYKPAPVDPLSGLPYSISGPDGAAVIYVTSNSAYVVNMNAVVIGSSELLATMLVFGNINGNESQSIDDYMYPPAAESKNGYMALALDANQTTFQVQLPLVAHHSSGYYFILFNNKLVAMDGAEQIGGTQFIDIGYAGLAPQTHEQIPPPESLNYIVFFLQDETGNIARTKPGPFTSYGNWIGNQPPLKDEYGDDLNRFLPQAQIINLFRGVLTTDTLEEYRELRVLIPELPSEYHYQTATVRLYMNGYWPGTERVRAGAPTDPGMTVDVTIVPGPAGTRLKFNYDVVFGYGPNLEGDLLYSYVDYNIGDAYMMRSSGYKTNTV